MPPLEVGTFGSPAQDGILVDFTNLGTFWTLICRVICRVAKRMNGPWDGGGAWRCVIQRWMCTCRVGMDARTGSPGSGDLWEMSPSVVVLGGRIWEPRGIAEEEAVGPHIPGPELVATYPPTYCVKEDTVISGI